MENQESLFLSNQSERKFIERLKEEIRDCKRFYFSVSFIKYAGLKLIEDDLLFALKKGVEGYLITSTYQNFTDIPSLREFLRWSKEYPNFHVHLDYECFSSGFHSKGYLFEKKNGSSFFVGSSNLTRFALLYNVEWNILLSNEKTCDSIRQAKKEFDLLWEKTLPLDSSLIERYKNSMAYAIVKWDMDYYLDDEKFILPNLMQKRALRELKRNRDLGISKSLIIAATGSGKTYLSAFDARNFDAKHLLYIVHRESILEDAMKTFATIFKARRSYGLYTGCKQETNVDFLFASSSMLSRHLEEFSENEFDYIIFDEVHHIVTECGKKIFEYFKPDFLLGLTATPERMDNQDVFSIFDDNVSFEMRLKDALANHLVVPFHYYGIRDEHIDYSSSNNSIIAKEIASDENIEFITKQIEKYRMPNEKLKAIAFCTSISHAFSMKEAFENAGYNALSLTGKNDTGQRIKAFHDLQDEECPLEIICCVDILNEGVDIPRINMLLFLRPTESSTIFLQQLGRGLRKAENKDSCIVLDFIGNNYKRSIQIAFALGTLSKSPYIEKYTLKSMIRTNFASLGIENLSILFDDLSKKEIIAYLDDANFYRADFLKKDYLNFKKYIRTETYPSHMDYLNNDIAPDLIKFMKTSMNGQKNCSYYVFLKKINEDSLPIFSEDEIEFINNVSDFLPLVRVDEFLILKEILTKSSFLMEEMIGFNEKVTARTLHHALSLLKKKNLIRDENHLSILCEKDAFREYLLDLLNYGIGRYEIEFPSYDGDFKLMANYYKEQVMMILLEENTQNYMKGTKFDLERKEAYLFVNLNKDKQATENLNYKDKFISENIFQWESENDTTKDNATGRKLQMIKTVHLFIRKMKAEHGVMLPYTCFGTGHFENMRESSNESKPTLLFDVILENKVEEEYFEDYDVPSQK